MLAALRHRQFALLWSGQALSAIGNRMFPVVLALVVLDRHGAAALGAVLAVQGAALLAGALAAAAVTDRLPRRTIMIVTDAGRALGVAALTFAPEPTLVPIVAAIALAEGLFQPAYAALLPRVLPAGRLREGNSLTAFSQYTAMIVGPSLAGAVIAAAGTTAALWIDVGTFAASLVTLVPLHEPRAGPPAAPWTLRGTGRDLAGGLRAVLERPWLAASMATSTLVMTLAIAPMMLAAPLAAGGPRAYGALFTALGAGCVIGTVLAARLRTGRPGVAAVAGLLAVTAAPLALAALPLTAVLLLWGVAGAGITVYEVLWTTAVQQDVPDSLLGRVMALDWVGSEALTPVGYLLAGFAVTAVGTAPVLVAAACTVAFTAPLALLVRGGAMFSTPA
ncbi:MFS transporter [Spirillospora sp. NPDC029432]|uniref:MFS transporter n=1 Tax=Spirillospora sp. NPDC029432 TaxID=3154599 RepID=UPI003455FD9D